MRGCRAQVRSHRKHTGSREHPPLTPALSPVGRGRSAVHHFASGAMRSELRFKSSAIRARCAELGSTPGVASHGDLVGRASSVRAWIQHDAASFKGHFFGLLFFWASKRKVTRAAAADRNARCVSGTLASTQQPSDIEIPPRVGNPLPPASKFRRPPENPRQAPAAKKRKANSHAPSEPSAEPWHANCSNPPAASAAGVSDEFDQRQPVRFAHAGA